MKKDEKVVRVLFVCMGNICRSPTAQGVLEKLVSQRDLAVTVQVDSAGTHAYHAGDPPDRRAQATAERYQMDISGQRARQVEASDFERFSMILGMDKDNLLALRQRCPRRYQSRIGLLMDYAPAGYPRNVPDPYYGNIQGFDHVVKMIQVACEHLLDHIAEEVLA